MLRFRPCIALGLVGSARRLPQNATTVSSMLGYGARRILPHPYLLTTFSKPPAQQASSHLPFLNLRRLLVWRKAVIPKTRNGSAANTDTQPGTSFSFTDALTTISQVILIGTTATIIFAAFVPEKISDRLSNYKSRLTERRHEKMLQHMASNRPYISATMSHKHSKTISDGKEDVEISNIVSYDQIYHWGIAKDMENVLFTAPIVRYGILSGSIGSGKSRLMRRLAVDRPYMAFLSMGLISGVKSLVDALSEEVGYDFDDWTERMLSSYFFNGQGSDTSTPLDKLAFLLDEIEEACWKLKYDPANSSTQNRPVLIFDDIDMLDMDDPPSRKALRMLFNAANKWAREDTAQVIFTCSDKTYGQTLGKSIRREVLDNAKVYTVGHLHREAAERFLKEHLHRQPTPSELRLVLAVLGTRIGDLLRVCEEANKNGKSLGDLVEEELATGMSEVARALTDVTTSLTGNTGAAKLNSLLRYLDARAAIYPNPRGGDGPAARFDSAISTRDTWAQARKAGVTELLEKLMAQDMIGYDGDFDSERVRNAYRRYRGLDKKKSWFRKEVQVEL
ncbi:hypothetical protein BC936DRAFT_138782 [Jimgerdemannia flammicorona]|uniref:P-loop containing nucleoside triphosphate hydrolase protein n=1 Tax=Jimgerdemannia flammicorona TaxID=994334 RepID=A0A433DIA0_9FUNG|nr:hypothetical protein BC936DRAFT_138782 [Jimgerdemannia flammicorona]